MFDAIYTRQSVDKADSISVTAQADFCRKEVVDYPIKVYTDKGYSGKNIDRPGFKELLADIEAGAVRRVIVYRLDRISRSVLDFANIIEIFQKKNVSFVSTMEKFDTDTPIGKAMLMIVMVFAQLERETIQRRVLDAYRSRSRRGFYMGGPVPFGYTLDEIVIDGIRTKTYKQIPEEVRAIQLMYDLYKAPQVSLRDVVRALNQNEVRRRDGTDFCVARVRDILMNPINVKADRRIYEFYKQQRTNVLNPAEDFVGTNGAYLYSSTDQNTRKSSDLSGKFLVLAPHEGIVDSITWIKCRNKLLGNVAVAKPLKAKATWLAGKIKCGYCGYSLVARTYHCKTKRDYRYFICSHKYVSAGCRFSTIDADQVEAYVFDAMRHKLEEFEILRRAKQTDVDLMTVKLKDRIAVIDSEIADLMGKLGAANDVLMNYINDRVKALDEEKRDLQVQINSAVIRDDDDPDAISGYLDKWDELSLPDKLTVVDSLIVKVTACKDKIQIYWKI